jgi:hypothetical protein
LGQQSKPITGGQRLTDPHAVVNLRAPKSFSQSTRIKTELHS